MTDRKFEYFCELQNVINRLDNWLDNNFQLSHFQDTNKDFIAETRTHKQLLPNIHQAWPCRENF